ncbi:hypothetical protein OPV22_034230 [Ensete ventricosum]|uniref:Uncharacterized protein n=1 Tax=Ensete ventricosum TaxID=4639 RepID=A0AAV8PP84_ENSVE|nr:hypothetical protein OPV22_034230 [Ensete ventricosum]
MVLAPQSNGSLFPAFLLETSKPDREKRATAKKIEDRREGEGKSEWTWEEEDEEERDPPPWDRQPGRIPASGRRGAGGSVRSPPLVGYSPPPLAISLTSPDSFISA